MCNPINPICDIGTVLGTVGSSVAGSVFNEIANAFASAARKVTDWMWTVIAKTTAVDLSGSWFHTTFGLTVTLSGLVIAALFALEVLKGALRREPGALGRATVGLGAGILGAAASIGVVTALLRATDALSDGVVKTSGLDGIAKLGSELAPTAALSSIGSPALMLILAIGYLVASFFVWGMFVFRKAMLIVAAVFAPVAFAGAPLRATSAWVRRWVEFTATMIFAKLLVVILFTLAVSLVGSPGKGFAAVGNLFSGLALLVIACFAPWLLFRLVHFVGGDLIAAHHSVIAQSTMQAGATPVSLARSGAMRVAPLIGGASAGAGRPAIDGAAARPLADAAPPAVGGAQQQAITGSSGGTDGGASPRGSSQRASSGATRTGALDPARQSRSSQEPAERRRTHQPTTPGSDPREGGE